MNFNKGDRLIVDNETTYREWIVEDTKTNYAGRQIIVLYNTETKKTVDFSFYVIDESIKDGSLQHVTGPYIRKHKF